MPARWSQFGAHVPVDVIESEKEFTIKANVPGMSKEDLEVEIGEDAVVLKGKYDSETEKDERGYKIKERHAGSFTRVVPVSSAVNTEKATARYKDGVLELVLPKLVPETPKRRKLDVQ
jgi:HSP20 family protein